jgi:predicted amidophosphoribosyltransferase
MLTALADALLPLRCANCGRRGAALCDRCARTLLAAPRSAPPAPIAWWTACFSYEGAARELVARAKYRDERHALRFAHELLARVVVAEAPTPIDIVTWVPASRARRRAHGVDHGELIARVVARHLGIPVRRLLDREPGPPQTGRDARRRRNGPALHARETIAGATVLVVDDVATTGGTLAAAGRALRAARARAVYAATIARTRRPQDPVPRAAYTPAHISVSSSLRRAWTSSSSAST